MPLERRYRQASVGAHHDHSFAHQIRAPEATASLGKNLLLSKETDAYRQSKVWHGSCVFAVLNLRYDNANLSSTRIPDFVIRAKDSMARVEWGEHLGE